MSDEPGELESLINAALVVAASEWDPDCALPRGRMVRLGTRHVMRTLELHGYLTDDTTPDDLAQTRARALADGRLAAFADAFDLTPLLASRTGLSDPAGELVGVARDLPDGRVRDLLLSVAAGITGTNYDEENDRG